MKISIETENQLWKAHIKGEIRCAEAWKTNWGFLLEEYR